MRTQKDSRLHVVIESTIPTNGETVFCYGGAIALYISQYLCLIISIKSQRGTLHCYLFSILT